MAKIVLNVELNNQIGKEVEKIKTSLQGIQVPKTSLANTAQLQKSYANLFNTIKNSKGAYPEDVFKGVAEKVEKNLNEIKKLNTSFKTNGELTKQEKQLYSQLKKELNQLSAQFATMRAETNKLEKTNKLAIPSVDNLRKRYADLLNTIKNTKKYYKKGTFDDITTKAKGYLEELKGLDSTSETYAEDVNRLDKNLNQLSADFAETRQSATNFHGSLQDIISGFLKFQLAAMFVMKPLNAIRNAWASINETLVKTEDAVVSLKRVLNDDSLSDETISGKLYDLAVKYGQTFENANEIAQNFARTGMNWNETIKATEAALLALNVAELDATQASDGMIAIMQQFGYEASNLTVIIDILNKTADNYAVTTDKLLTALQRTGSSAKNANLSLQETVGIVTALSEATGRSGENLGTAVNSLIQFSTKSSALDTFAKLSDNMATLVEDFRHGKGTVLDIWQGLSAEIKNASGSNESILSGLFGDDDWRNLNEELQDALGENFAKVTEIYDTASTFRKNYFIALLNNMDTVEKAIGTASDAAGYSQKENEKYLNTYTAKVNQLNAEWEKLANNEKGLLGIKKRLVDIGFVLTKYVLGNIGGIRTIAVALGGFLLSLLPSLISKLKVLGLTLNSTLGWLGLIATAVSAVVGGIQSAVKAQEEARQKAIETYEANKKTAQSLQELYDKYKQLRSESNRNDEQNKTLSKTEQEIVKILQEKYGILQNLTQGTEGYTNALENLTRAELNKYRQDKITAAEAAQESLAQYNYGGYKKSWWGSKAGKSQISWGSESELAQSVGIDFTGDDSVLMLSGLDDKNNVSSTLQNNKVFKEAYDKLYSAYEDALKTGNIERAKQISESQLWSNLSSAISEAQGVIDKYFETNVDRYLSDYIIANGTIKTEEDYNKALNYVKQQINAGEYYDETIKNWVGSLDKYVKKQEEATGTVTSWADQVGKVVSNYQDILDIINAARDSEQEIVDLEEKKIELQKAQQALEDARNNRNVRVYNASTGNWELEADRDKVYEAQEKVWQAEKNLENATWSVLESEIKKGNMTAGEIYEKVKELATDFPTLAKTIRDAFVAKGYKMPEYDSGGVLRGLGGIKATSQDEIILPPNIAKKILQPTSNAEFAQFAKSLGLLFGSSKQVADMKSGMVVNNGGSTSTDNRSYVANGIPFSREIAETHTLAELFEMAANFNN